MQQTIFKGNWKMRISEFWTNNIFTKGSELVNRLSVRTQIISITTLTGNVHDTSIDVTCAASATE